MIKIITPDQFKTVPWKNGKGKTVELAISSGGDVNYFDWRISIADMNESGVFSDFSGYQRELVMIAGKGLDLVHHLNADERKDKLRSIADKASFDGASQTVGTLLDGSVKNFNVMAKIGRYEVVVTTHVARQTLNIPACDHCFVYNLSDDAQVSTNKVCLEKHHLLSVNKSVENAITVTGKQLIMVVFNQL